MTTAVATLNCTVGEIEELLAKGTPIEQIARDLQEPRQNVVAVWNRWRQNNGAAQAGDVRPMAVVQPGHRMDESAITVAALVAAAGRSSSKRTQALGVRLADVAKVVRDRLADERRAAEEAEKRHAERERAAADVARLEAQLRDARAKLRPSKRQASSRKPTPAQTPEAMAALRARSYGEFPCSKGCGKVATTKAGLMSHERHCTGGVS